MHESVRRLAVVVLCTLPTDLAAQQIEFGSSPNPVGSGARALGIASAFIATADDATAASWNPGGLVALEKPEASVVLSYKRRAEEFGGPGIAVGDELQTFTYPGVNYFSLAYPFKVGSRFFIAALSYQALIDFDMHIKRTFTSAGSGVRSETFVDFLQQGSLRTWTPALAFQISPQLAVGVAVNLSTDRLGYENGWRQTQLDTYTVVLGTNTLEDTRDLRDAFSFDGAGVNLGMLWDVTPRWTIGAVAKTPIWGTLTRTAELLQSAAGASGQIREELEEPMRLPPSYGLGVAYRHSDRLTVSADVYRTEWSLFRHGKTNLGTSRRKAINPISGEQYRNADVPGITQAHLGAERLFVLTRTVIPVRGGLFYDPEPKAAGVTHFVGAALGTGVSVGDLIIDAAYQVRRTVGERSVTVRVSEEGSDAVATSTTGGSVWQNLFYLSTIYHF